VLDRAVARARRARAAARLQIAATRDAALARLLTGPLAFLAAGVIDVLAFALGSLREAARRRGRLLAHRRPDRGSGD
jgi:hypothetical protein